MKIITGPVKNAVSLGDMFHDTLLSFFQSQDPNATDEQIAEVEKGIRELIEGVADFWHEEVSKPLMAIEKLGKNQYVCWEDPGKEGYESILESKNLDEWILACTNEAELKEMVGGALMHPLLQQHTQLIEQAFHAYERGSYALSILGMLAAIDALLSGVSGMINSTGMKQRINSIFDKLNQKRTVTKREMKDLCLGFTTAETLKRLTITKNFDESEPENINRHWLMHGRSRREISRLDCIKMLRLINGILLVHELADAKLDE